jgi:hypothetical protein
MPKAKEITAKQRDGLLGTLKARFDAHMHRHAGLEWSTVQARLESNSGRLWSLNEMEQSGGEPDVVGIDKTTSQCIFVDCSAQSPKGRRSLWELGQFDTTTSSWVQTPAKIRKLGGALFCDRRYDTVFLYHNGAESYYAARGFRCSLRV